MVGSNDTYYQKTSIFYVHYKWVLDWQLLVEFEQQVVGSVEWVAEFIEVYFVKQVVKFVKLVVKIIKQAVELVKLVVEFVKQVIEFVKLVAELIIYRTKFYYHLVMIQLHIFYIFHSKE